MSVERLEEGSNAACVCCSGEEGLCVSLKAIMRDLFLDGFYRPQTQQSAVNEQPKCVFIAAWVLWLTCVLDINCEAVNNV